MPPRVGDAGGPYTAAARTDGAALLNAMSFGPLVSKVSATWSMMLKKAGAGGLRVEAVRAAYETQYGTEKNATEAVSSLASLLRVWTAASATNAVLGRQMAVAFDTADGKKGLAALWNERFAEVLSQVGLPSDQDAPSSYPSSTAALSASAVLITLGKSFPAPSGDAMVDSEWPHLREGLSEREPVVRLPWVSPKLCFGLACFPDAGLVLAMYCLRGLAGDKDSAQMRELIEFISPLYLKAWTSGCGTRLWTPDWEGDGGDANMRRWIYRFVLLVSYQIAVTCTLESVLQHHEKRLRPAAVGSSVEPTGQRPAADWFDIAEEEMESAVTAATTFVEDTKYPRRDAWVFSPSDGVVPLAVSPDSTVASSGITGRAKSDRGDAQKCLSDLLRPATSGYRMPESSAGHRVWQQWLDKLRALKSMYSDFPHHVAIALLTSTLNADDPRVLGWSDVAAEKTSFGHVPSLEDFLQHVSRNVLSSDTTRRSAAAEFEQLVQEVHLVDDCMALCGKLRQSMSRIFPVGVSLEPEPMTRLRFCICVHGMLLALKGGSRKKRIVRQWQAFTSYDHSGMFTEFIDEEQHTAGKTVMLTARYLSKVYEQLEAAHRMDMQTNHVQETTRPQSQDQSVKALAQSLNIKQSALRTVLAANFVTGGAETRKRGRSASKKEKSGGSSKSSEPVSSKSRGDEQKGTFRDRLKAAFVKHKDAIVAADLRSAAGLPKMDWGAMLDKASNGGCLLCLEKGHGMGAAECLAIKKAPVAAEQLRATLRATLFPK